MDQDMMAKALKSVLGEGYEAQSRTSARGATKSPSPHDYLQGRVSKSGPVGSDLHVPSTESAKGKKKRPALKPVEYVAKSSHAPKPGQKPMSMKERGDRLETKSKVSQTLLSMGATGGVLSLPALSRHTKHELQAGGILKPKFGVKDGRIGPPKKPSKVAVGAGAAKAKLKPVAAKVAAKPAGKLKPVAAKIGSKLPGTPKGRAGAAGAALAVTAGSLEMAGLAGDFLGHHTIHEQRKFRADEKRIANQKLKAAGGLKPAGAVRKSADLDMETFSKVDDDKRQVFGWCSISKKDGVDVIDLQGDHVPIEEIEKSAYAYMLSSRKGGNQHQRVYARTEDGGLKDDPKHVADVIESVIYTPEKIEAMGLPEDFTQGWWLGMQIHDEDTWQQIKRGERAGFSIHGKGRREPVEAVSKAGQRDPGTFSYQNANPGTLGFRPRTKKERIESGSLGIAGATAAGSGLGAAALPIAAKKMSTAGGLKAERVRGRLMTVGAITGGAAGVYSGLHAAHNAAKPVAVAGADKVKSVHAARKTKKTAKVAKAWSPVVDHASPEYKRHRRAKGYQIGAAATSAGALGVAGGAEVARRGSLGMKAHVGGIRTKHYNQMKAAGQEVNALRAKRDAIKVPGKANLQRNLKRESNRRYKAGASQIDSAAKKADAAVFARHTAAQKKATGKRVDVVAEMRPVAARGRTHRAIADSLRNTEKKHALRAIKATKVRNRAGLLALGAAGAAGVIGQKRKNSWRSYPGQY